MKEKWNREANPVKISNGQPSPQRFQILSEPMYRPKLLLKSPSLRAINNYNNLSINDGKTITTTSTPTTTLTTSYDNLNFIPENYNVDPRSYDASYTINNLNNSIYPNSYDLYDYTTTIGSSSIKTTISNSSELDSEKNDIMGSTAKLVSPKMEMSCQTWFTHIQTIFCTISLSAGFGNLYRLPQQVLIQGGIPFLIVYIILTLFIGLPLLFLEFGIGQLAQEGFIKSWRAIPFFKGVGYVKLIAGCLLSVYYSLYLGLALYYIVWLSKGTVPLQECSTVKITETGYSTDGIDGQQCLKKTFLESPFVDPYWYGIFAGILFIIWIIVTILSIRRTKSFIRSLSILLLPVLICFVALIVKSVLIEEEFENLRNLRKTFDWSILKNANVWYFAAIQVFFSTNVGFGSFATNAGIIYNKVNPLWTALGYIAINLVFGVSSVLMLYILSDESTLTLKTDQVPELHLVAVLYTVLVKSDNAEGNKIWTIIAFTAIVLSGFISMATITYTLLKAITVQNKRRLKWWQTSIVLSFIGFVSSCCLLLKTNFELVHLLDHYIVGNLILITVIFEVFAFIVFYRIDRIKSDFEFMLGHILSKIWLILWWIMPFLLISIFVWTLCTINLQGIFQTDPVWLYGTGWGVVITATIFIFVIGFYTVTKQDGYTFIDKMKASFKPCKNWGPKDPMLRYTWVQWNSKAQQGERDFTLKRKGTRDYTRSIKRNAKKAELHMDNSDLTITTPSTNPIQSRTSNSSSNGYVEPYIINNNEQTVTLRRAQQQQQQQQHPLRITSLVDSLDSPPITHAYLTLEDNYEIGYKTNINPLSRPHTYGGGDRQETLNDSTVRKGPYVIPGTKIQHVCHRRYSQSEDATEL